MTKVRFSQKGHLAAARGMTEALAALGQYDLNDGLRIVAIRLAIIVGNLENKPVDISSIAVMTGIPRSTVKRLVDFLIKAQVTSVTKMGKRKIVIPNPDRTDRKEMLDSICRLILKAAETIVTAENSN